MVAHNADPIDLSYSDESVELSMFHYRHYESNAEVVLVHVYNHPSKHRTIKNFEAKFDNFMEQHRDLIGKNLIVFGDFNIDFNLSDNEIQRLKRKLELKFRIRPTLDRTPTRPKSGNQLDWVFSSMSENLTSETSLYTTWFSDHSPLYTDINFIN